MHSKLPQKDIRPEGPCLRKVAGDGRRRDPNGAEELGVEEVIDALCIVGKIVSDMSLSRIVAFARA